MDSISRGMLTIELIHVACTVPYTLRKKKEKKATLVYYKYKIYSDFSTSGNKGKKALLFRGFGFWWVAERAFFFFFSWIDRLGTAPSLLVFQDTQCRYTSRDDPETRQTRGVIITRASPTAIR